MTKYKQEILTYVDYLLNESTVESPVWNIEQKRSSSDSKKRGWNYVDGCMIKAILDLYSITKDERYFEFADAFIDARVHEDGTIDGYDVNEKNIDNVNAGKTLFELYDVTGKEKYKKAIDLIYSQIEGMPRTEEGSFWHKNIYPHQVWLDGLYMAQPFYMMYENRYDNCAKYDDIFLQFENVFKNMKNPTNGLYYHCYDCSRQMFWCDPVSGIGGLHWLRASGWFVMAILDTLDACDREKAPEKYDMLAAKFKEVIDALLKYQQENGMWYQIINQPGQEKNYLETSGSAIMAYGILKGVRLGFLDESYAEYGLKAFEGICDKYLSIGEDGKLHLGGICLVAGLGGKTKRSGTYEYYMSEPIVNDDAKGTGPFLMAFTEVLRRG